MEDENLYGHSTFAQTQNGNGLQEWFIVSKDGTAVSIGFGQRGYNDLATGGPVKKHFIILNKKGANDATSAFFMVKMK